jgi:hypothetical protein
LEGRRNKDSPCGEWSGKPLFKAAARGVTYYQLVETAAGNKTKELHSRVAGNSRIITEL